MAVKPFKKKVWLSSPTMHGDEFKFVEEAYNTNWMSTVGANIDEVKKANLHGFKYIKCGKFDESEFIGSQKTDDYMQFATKNQQLYDANLKLLSKDGIYNF